MIEGLKPYVEYKESGHRWLGQVPSRWSLLPLCRVATPKTECGRTDLELLSVYLHRGVIRYSESGGQVHKPSMDLSKYQVVEPGDFVLNNQQAWRGSIGVSKYQGIISPAYVVMKLSKTFRPEYANYLFRSPAMVAQYVVASRGVGDIQRNLYYPDLRGSTVVVPPPDEQAAIVRILDHANRKIDGFIRAKRKLIGLLNEQKQAIIYRAVTRGIHLDVPLKPSGIPWLGDIPKHWELWPNRAFLSIRKVLVGDRHPEFTLLSLTKRGVIIRDLSGMRGKFSSDMGTSQEVRRGDMVFCLFDVPETPRTVGLSEFDGMITGAYTVMECKNREIAEYLELFYIAMDDHKALSPLYSGLRNTIPKASLLGAKTPIPPAQERVELLRAVKDRTASLDATIGRSEREIALMQEFRTRLTADIVTGKLDVRESASKLPEEQTNMTAPPDEPLEEIAMEEHDE